MEQHNWVRMVMTAVSVSLPASLSQDGPWYQDEYDLPLKHRINRFIPSLEVTLEIMPALRAVFSPGGPIATALGVGFPFHVIIRGHSRESYHATVRDTDEDRWLLYVALEHGLEKLGLNGRACVLRAVCEAAQLRGNENGLVGEIVTVLLQVSQPATNNSVLADYYEASENGRRKGKCHRSYSACPFSIFKAVDVVSV